MSNIKCIFGVLAFALFTAPSLFAQGGWSVQGNDIERVFEDRIFVSQVPQTSGTADITSVTLTGDEESGDVISASSITSPKDYRTFVVVVNEADADASDFWITITGRNQFFGTSTVTYKAVGDATLIGNVAFAPYPEPVITLTYLEEPEAGDVIQVFSYGFALRSNPQVADDITVETFYDESAGTFTDLRNDGGWSFSTAYNTRYSTYIYASAALEDEIIIKGSTSANVNGVVPNVAAVGMGGRVQGTNFVQTVTE